jgi:hypothetical protein
MAILNEPRAVIDAHLFRLPEFHEDGRLLPVGELLVLSQYPERRQVRPFYAQSVALVELLVKERGTATFARFLRDAQQAGYERSLRAHYHWTIADLEQRWQRYLRPE